MRRFILGNYASGRPDRALALYWLTRPLPVLTVTTWPGAYGRAQPAALIEPYRDVGRVDVASPMNGTAIWRSWRRAVTSHTYKGDVIDFELPKAVEACRAGLLEKIDAASLPPGADGTPAAQDFVPGAIGPCWVGSVVYSQVIVFAPERIRRRHARDAGGFLRPGEISRPARPERGAKFNLEMALLADGVAPEDVYNTLATDAGLARAFAKLDTSEARSGLVAQRRASPRA